jgi:hypothetical protein
MRIPVVPGQTGGVGQLRGIERGSRPAALGVLGDLPMHPNANCRRCLKRLHTAVADRDPLDAIFEVLGHHAVLLLEDGLLLGDGDPGDEALALAVIQELHPHLLVDA